MPKTIIESRLHSNKHKPKIKPELKTRSNFPPNLQALEQKLLSGKVFLVHK